MRLKYILSGLLASTVISAAAFAQSPVPAPAVSVTTTETIIRASQWRASKLIGVDVYNTANEKAWRHQ
jgi:hypothetical protein